MAEEIEIKLVELDEQIISIQNREATFFDHLVKFEKEKLEEFQKIQSDFMKMQNELRSLIEKK